METRKEEQQARVLYKYVARQCDELDLLEVGEIITVTKKECGDAGWFEGELQGKRGLFPSNYVELIEVEAPCETPPPPPQRKFVTADKTSKSTSSVPNCLSFKSPSPHTVNFKNAHAIITNQLKASFPGTEPPKCLLKPVPPEMFLENHDNGAPPASQVSQLVIEAEKRSADTQKSPDLRTAPNSVSYRANKIKRHDSRSEGYEALDELPLPQKKKAPPKVSPKSRQSAHVPSAFVLKPVSSVAECEYVTRSKYDELMKIVEQLSNRVVTLELAILNKNLN
uniref:SH3 domain-containing protein n=1 Tax=Steinernema glaseri TaxID=37863 RepID=A0A1I8AMS2_9BILA